MAEKKKELPEKELLKVTGGWYESTTSKNCVPYSGKKDCEKHGECKWENDKCIYKY